MNKLKSTGERIERRYEIPFKYIKNAFGIEGDSIVNVNYYGDSIRIDTVEKTGDKSDC